MQLWKAEFERVDLENKSTVVQYRQKAATLENALAPARGRLGAVEEALAAAQQRGRDLESALVAANATPSENRKEQREFDRHQYRNRNLIERFFAHIKQFRRVATRYDKLASRFGSFVALAASLLWPK